MTDKRILTCDQLEVIDLATVDMPVGSSTDVRRLLGHIAALTETLEYIAGEAVWLDEATGRASEVLARVGGYELMEAD